MSQSMTHQILSKVILKDQRNGHSTGKCESYSIDRYECDLTGAVLSPQGRTDFSLSCFKGISFWRGMGFVAAARKKILNL